jgi:hypothetical protein
VFAATHVPVRNLIDYLEHGSSLDEFLADFPSVTREQALSMPVAPLGDCDRRKAERYVTARTVNR